MKGFMKDGWHPKGNDGGKESWRGDFKGINQVAGWVGKGKSGSDRNSPEVRVSRPISSLKDPSSFGRPPQRANTFGSVNSSSPVTRYNTQEPEPEPEIATPAPPPVPYRADTTGLTTSHLPPPPLRRNTEAVDSRPSEYNQKPKPSLPPRLPPRRDESSEAPPPAYESVTGNSLKQLNQGAINRLGKAGVSVPALGIDQKGSGSHEHNNFNPAAAVASANELQTRFNQFNRASPVAASARANFSNHLPSPQSNQHNYIPSLPLQQQPQQQQYPPQAPPPRKSSDSPGNHSGGTTPTGTPSSLRENEHVQAGIKKLSGFNQKYGITKKINNFIEDQKSPAYPAGQGPQHHQHSYPHAQSQPQLQPQLQPQPPPPQMHQPQCPHTHSPYQVSSPPVAPSNPPYAMPEASSSRPDLGNRKPPPPPPPPKKPGMKAFASNTTSPPPLPLNTKPR
ncbi:hypothetical protein FQN57_000160 [Myotisia sp. PD_48]|nr:hypothetical protein FQN57_000160 [Myotisia sp. PD_48]